MKYNRFMVIFLILGHKLEDDSSMNQILINRLDKAIRFYDFYRPNKIIVTGGITNKNTCVSEAKVMKDYLVSKGINKDLIIEEDAAKVTKDNITNIVSILKDLRPDEVIMFTSNYHAARWYNNPVRYFKKYLNEYHLTCITSE